MDRVFCYFENFLYGVWLKFLKVVFIYVNHCTSTDKGVHVESNITWFLGRGFLKLVFLFQRSLSRFSIFRLKFYSVSLPSHRQSQKDIYRTRTRRSLHQSDTLDWRWSIQIDVTYSNSWQWTSLSDLLDLLHRPIDTPRCVWYTSRSLRVKSLWSKRICECVVEDISFYLRIFKRVNILRHNVNQKLQRPYVVFFKVLFLRFSRHRRRKSWTFWHSISCTELKINISERGPFTHVVKRKDSQLKS